MRQPKDMGEAFEDVQTLKRWATDRWGGNDNDRMVEIAEHYEHVALMHFAEFPAKPIPMRIHCPECGELHIDEGEFATKPHHTHACQKCGAVFRPARVDTVGVRFLPGFKNEEPTDVAAK